VLHATFMKLFCKSSGKCIEPGVCVLGVVVARFEREESIWFMHVCCSC
jgi:hypothetical protein